MKVLFCGLKNEYGDPKRGASFEYKSFFNSLKNMDGVQAEMFAMDEVMAEVGRDEMNRRLITEVEKTKPDLLFCFLFTEEIKKETIGYITRKTSTKTFNWFGDDHWRFPIFSKAWAPVFTAVSTTDSLAFKKYNAAGIKNVIKTQWAANPFLYKPQPKTADDGRCQITFYGQNYGTRAKYITALKKAGLPAEGIGRGWGDNKGADVSEMLNIYSFSKINLNFTQTQYATAKERLKLFGKLFVKKESGKIKPNLENPIDNIQSIAGTQTRTIKARTFEVPACGGFLLTERSDEDLSEYFQPDKEMVIFRDTGELIEKSKYYLEHDNERQLIAEAGYKRVLKEHTYPLRLKKIFEFLGL